MNCQKLILKSAITTFTVFTALSGTMMLSESLGKRLDNQYFTTAQKYSDVVFGLSMFATGISLFTFSQIQAEELRKLAASNISIVAIEIGESKS